MCVYICTMCVHVCVRIRICIVTKLYICMCMWMSLYVCICVHTNIICFSVLESKRGYASRYVLYTHDCIFTLFLEVKCCLPIMSWPWSSPWPWSAIFGQEIAGVSFLKERRGIRMPQAFSFVFTCQWSPSLLDIGELAGLSYTSPHPTLEECYLPSSSLANSSNTYFVFCFCWFFFFLALINHAIFTCCLIFFHLSFPYCSLRVTL